MLGQRGRRAVLVLTQTEVVHRYRFATRADARRAIFAWINRYNQHRPHSSLGYLPPIEWQQLYRQAQTDQAA